MSIRSTNVFVAHTAPRLQFYSYSSSHATGTKNAVLVCSRHLLKMRTKSQIYRKISRGGNASVSIRFSLYE